MISLRGEQLAVIVSLDNQQFMVKLGENELKEWMNGTRNSN